MTRYHVVARRDPFPKRPGLYLSFPGLVRAADGDLILAYRRARSAPGTWSHGNAGDVVITRETAGQWSDPVLLYSHDADFEEMGCGDLSRTADGTIYFFSRQYRPADHLSRVYLATSSDDGRTFTSRRPITVPEFPVSWCPYGKLIELPDGTLLLGAYGRRKDETKSSSALLASTDRGATWSLHSWIAVGDDPDGHNYFEPLTTRFADGSFISLLRTNGTFYLARSTGDARTWSAPERAFQGMAAASLVLRSGELMVTYRGIHPWHAPAGHEHEREPAIRPRQGRLYCWRTTADGGRTWSPEGVLDDGTALQVGSYGMGDLVELPDGRVRVIFYTSDRDQTPWLQETTLAPTP